jgi:hypothetical protein
MKKRGKIYSVVVVALCLAIGGLITISMAETEQQQREQVRAEVSREFEQMGMPVLTGSAWQKATQSEKVAFVWGVCHVVTIEKILAQKFPSLKAEDFSAKVAEGMAGLKINDIVSSVDDYYAKNPAQIEKPVIGVIWDALVKPKLKTGIAGHPLQ